MYEYIVPQEFNQDDRIGNFTIPQAFILGIGVILGMGLLASGMNIFLAIFLEIPLGILIVTLMYKKKYEMPIYEFALVYMMYRATPKLLIYKKENIKDIYLVEEDALFLEEETENLNEEG